jgi:hypothetical protein
MGGECCWTHHACCERRKRIAARLLVANAHNIHKQWNLQQRHMNMPRRTANMNATTRTNKSGCCCSNSAPSSDNASCETTDAAPTRCDATCDCAARETGGIVATAFEKLTFSRPPSSLR